VAGSQKGQRTARLLDFGREAAAVGGGGVDKDRNHSLHVRPQLLQLGLVARRVRHHLPPWVDKNIF